MAVSKNKKARRLAGLALAISAVAIPSVALADPDHDGRGWGSRSEEGNRGDRGDRQRSEGNPGWRAQPQQQQAAPQADAQWQGRSRGNWGGGNAAPQAAPAPQQQAQPQWQGRQDRGWAGRNWGGNNNAPQAAPVPAPQPAQQTWNGGNHDANRGQPAWRGSADQRGWSDGDRRDRDHNRDGDRSWNGRPNPARVLGGYYGTNNGYYRDHHDWNRDGDRDRRSWNRGWRDNSRYNWYGYRSSHPSYFRLGTYRAPYRNYSYRRLSIGIYLDSLFFDQDYWIDNPGYYRLPDVYGPYRWVRYYDDALLVDIYSGEVVDVIYDFFW